MLPDRVSNPGPLTYESGALPIALRGPAPVLLLNYMKNTFHTAQSHPMMTHLYHFINVPYRNQGAIYGIVTSAWGATSSHKLLQIFARKQV